MEGYSGALKGYWKRKQYQRLGNAGEGGGGAGRRWRRRRTNHHRVQLATAGARADTTAGSKRRKFWRIKVAPRFGFLRRAVSPRRFLARVRDAYVRMMLSFANSGAFSGGGLGYYGSDMVPAGFVRPALKEYDEKMIVDIYKSLMAQGHLMAAAAATSAVEGGGQAAQVVPRR